ncbi:MAG: tRNA (adenosine(37)-N6)-threonylcarbamoyltransferase complex transferase subunit TsaD [Candidatus Sungbacteria bacterium]|nr:tRNA (adenosine(37)-N6)-threonylcarbamoyltransferase complex transferase subunit TsaD [Candidatus Sungbacteria bacterium]
MRILGIETSCDETALAIADFSGSRTKPAIKIRSHIVSSQRDLHTKFGGVVPNLARREHEKNLAAILMRVLEESEILKPGTERTGQKTSRSKFAILDSILGREQELLRQFKESVVPSARPRIDAIAVTCGPGLAPALWVGVNFARALAYHWNKPLISVNHMAGHLYAATLQKNKAGVPTFAHSRVKFPVLALLVSGGHTELVLVQSRKKFIILGQTRDDAAGEAFDKVGRMLKLPYPGGPAISAMAETEVQNSEFSAKDGQIKFPRPMINAENYDFSFSGLKTSVLYFIRGIEKTHSIKKLRPAIAREFQNAVVDVLVAKTLRAAGEYQVRTILVGGGVAASECLRKTLRTRVAERLPNVPLLLADPTLSGDNGLMICLAAYFSGKKTTWRRAHVNANLRIDETT